MDPTAFAPMTQVPPRHFWRIFLMVILALGRIGFSGSIPNVRGQATDRSPAAESISPPSARPISFNDQIRPILSDRCFYCHGPDEKHREAGLRLDSREGATEDRGDGRAIDPGNADGSLLIRRVIETDADLVMPPPASKHGRLSEAEVQTLRRWIGEGAEYEPHWAFAPLSDAEPPSVSLEQWPSNPIDRFVLAKLEQAGITPSPEADRATLIRRVSLDLTGLVPDIDQVAEFVSDRRADAYERMVDSFLASPHLAERWGRHWLDQARYADSHGYTIDSQREMWPYRDWVIRAIGDDMPFDRFTIEQLAGDLLPEATKMQKIASAFHRNTLINQEGGTDAEQFRHEAVVDRVNTTGAVWLGLTLGCAQCHTHKFDPITDREYYQMFAFFNSGTDVNSTGATINTASGEILGTPESPGERLLALRRHELERQLLDDLRRQRLAAAERAADEPFVQPWHAVTWRDEARLEIDGDAGLERLDDGSLRVVGKPAANATYRLPIDTSILRASGAAGAEPADKAGRKLTDDSSTPPEIGEIGGVRLRVLTDPSLPHRGPGRAGNGNFVLTRFNLVVGGDLVRPKSAVADHSQPEYPVTGAIDDDPKTGWAINIAAGSTAVMNANHEAVFSFDPPVRLSADSEVWVELHHQLNADYLIGRFAIDLSPEQPRPPIEPVDERLVGLLQKPEAERTGEEAKAVREAMRKAFASEADLFAEPGRASLMVMADLATPRKTFISVRGDFLRPDMETGELAPGGLSAVTPRLEAIAGNNRLDLAKWLVASENPLTPRVTVNRVWMRYFGRGLVETEEDFGTQGTPPTHPELLDWIARQFRDGGMSMKALHRLIVTSSTYRQASQTREDLIEIDPQNRLLARQNRIRVEAEIVRDAALAASGELVRTIGGPSVHPPQPDGVYSFTQNPKAWVADTGGGRYRRAMYTEFFRSAPHPLFTTFDAPDFQTVCTRRNRSNTPLQALTVANDETFMELARALAKRATNQLPDAAPPERLAMVFRLALNREATDQESEILQGFYRRVIDEIAGQPADAEKVWLGDQWQVTPASEHSSDDASAGRSDRRLQAAALVAVCRAILNTDNFITRE